MYKTTGNDFFKMKSYEDARKSYDQGINLLNRFKPSTIRIADELHTESDTLALSLHNNLALVLLLESNFILVKKNTDIVLNTYDSKNIKALYHRGKANTNLENFDDAKNDFKYILTINPDDDSAKKGLKEVKIKEKNKENERIKKIKLLGTNPNPNSNPNHR